MIVAGLMSGTSADGVDVAICDIRGEPGAMSAEILRAETFPYDEEMRAEILACCDRERSRVDQIAVLHFELAEVFANCLRDLLARPGASLPPLDLIGSHGQTLWHNVRPSGAVDASLQVVEGAVIAERTGITTIRNFRVRDIAAGGQGAPLTSYVDWLLLRHPTKWRAIQNIGGMGNVTFLPPLQDESAEAISFDTGPGNALLDIAVARLTGGNMTYDRDGELAKAGRVNEEWLDELLRHPYYERAYPKTTGRETFGSAAALELLAVAQSVRPDDSVSDFRSVTLTVLPHALVHSPSFGYASPARIANPVRIAGTRLYNQVTWFRSEVDGGGARNEYRDQLGSLHAGLVSRRYSGIAGRRCLVIHTNVVTVGGH